MKSTMTPAALGALLSGDAENFLAAAVPGGIEAQEKRGQIEQSLSETLPKDGTTGQNRKLWEDMGFVFGEDVDDIFVSAKFPEGWFKRPSDHSMWTHIVDNKGRKRGGIFYKAAFYDRSAHVRLEPRFSYTCYRETGAKETWAVAALDGDSEVNNFGSWKDGDWDGKAALEREAIIWLNQNKPDWRDASAYWD